MTTRLTNAMIACTVGLTAIVLVVDAIVSLASGAYLNLGSGVWLALARDTYEGVFYRPLWNGAEYGGTRYFPMLFVPIAGLMRAGMAAVPAGVTVSMLGLGGLAAAVATLLSRLAVPPALVALGTALAVAPYFVHQTAFAIRCEPIAAAFAIVGLAALVPMNERTESTRRLLLAAALFVCAFMTKVTCVYAPAAATLALLVAGRRTAALKLAAATTVGALLFLVALNIASDGRAIESFRACALGGSTLSSLLSPVAITRLVELIGTSHLLTVVFLLTTAAIVLSRRIWWQLPVLYLAGTAAITAVIFTSPGTILTSQIVDAYVAAIVVLTTLTAGQTAWLRTAGYAALLGLTVWTAAQNVVRVSGMLDQSMVRSAAEARDQLVQAVAACDATMVSESPLIPILAARRPVLLDPFAFHVVALNRPDLGNDLAERLRRREFACVVLEQDPFTAKGQAWYSNVNLTGAVMDAVVQHYVLDRTIAGERFYRPVQ
jgi:hypothetical protein